MAMKDDGLGDWRIKAIARLAKDLPAAFPGGPSHKAGAPVYLTTETKDSDGNSIGFITPSPTALSLNIAANAAKQATQLRRTITFREVLTPEGKGKTVANENNVYLFNYFEQCMIAISFSYQALETFSNDMIVSNLKGTYQLNRRGNLVEVSVDELQRETSTEEKLATILPDLLKKESPKGKVVWQDFKELKHIRDSIIHLKPNYQARVDIDIELIFCEFLRFEVDKFPKASFKMIEYFTILGQVVRWFESAREHIFTN
jgi:hypothetical protein